MMRPADTLKDPMVLAVVLVLVFVVDGLLLHRYQLAKGGAAATPSLDTALAGDGEVVEPSAQQAPGAKEIAEEGGQREGEVQDPFGIEELEPEPAPDPTGDTRLAVPPLADGLTLVPGEKEPAVMPVPQPAYEQEGDYQYGDYQYAYE
jgi:hypothetical protein